MGLKGPLVCVVPPISIASVGPSCSSDASIGTKFVLKLLCFVFTAKMFSSFSWAVDGEVEGEQCDAAAKENLVPESQNMAVEDTNGSNSTSPESVVWQHARRPFTSLSQVDADLALARTLQEQNDGGGDDEQLEDEKEGGEDEDDLFDVHGHEELDPAEFENNEAYARAVQDAEERNWLFD
ncbi:hypothetical protein EJ110_NYTH51497 [Nymphaea thermarum]|nr:hypothetical protein EJ110_NYTH51497 [Nymphaea thermarum]